MSKIEHGGPSASLASALNESLGVPVDVETVSVGSLPRSSFKPRRVAS